MMPKKATVDPEGRIRITAWDLPTVILKRFKRENGIVTKEVIWQRTYKQWLIEEAKRFGNTEIKSGDEGKLSLWVADPLPKRELIKTEF